MRIPARRLGPLYSVFGHGAWASVGIKPIPDWRLRREQGFCVFAVD